MASSTGTKLSREEYKRQQELENARKAGTAAPALDVEGNMINPHIPQYISQAPWYLSQKHAGLQHQKFKKEETFLEIGKWYQKGINIDVPLKFRKGACENCGSMTHKKKDCTERPRKLGAKWTNEDIKGDEVIIDVKDLNYSAKRDAYNGYDPEDYDEVLREYEKVEQLQTQMKREQVENEMIDDEAKGYAENAPMPGQQFDAKKRITVRNLRIREHTAKFLLNYDINSAYYDPKSRSMRGNPYPEHDERYASYITENFMRTTGETQEILKTQVFAWNSKEEDLSLQANPTKTEVLRKMNEVEIQKNTAIAKQTVIEKYGGEEHFDLPPMELILGQTERYIEYDRTGKIIKGEEKVIPVSKYREDELNSNHREIWGSYWDEGSWGYACCYSTTYNSYCVGQIGVRAKQKEIEMKRNKIEHYQNEEIKKKSLLNEHREALEKKKKEQKKNETYLKVNELKTSNSNHYNSNPSQAEIEEYRKTRIRHEDPMAKYK